MRCPWMGACTSSPKAMTSSFAPRSVRTAWVMDSGLADGHGFGRRRRARQCDCEEDTERPPAQHYGLTLRSEGFSCQRVRRIRRLVDENLPGVVGSCRATRAKEESKTWPCPVGTSSGWAARSSSP